VSQGGVDDLDKPALFVATAAPHFIVRLSNMPIIYPEYVDTKRLGELLAGGDDYIRTKENVVKGLALTRALNPDAPEVVVFGKGPRVVARAELFLRSGQAVPAYIKRRVNHWQYLGQYRATDIQTAPVALAHYGRTRPANSVAGALLLERVDMERVQVSGGGFPDSKTREAIEQAAVQFVVKELDGRQYKVEDFQRENRGYDLLAQRPGSRLLVEVKGTDSVYPRFFLTRNENSVGRQDLDWRLFVVCEARSQPRLHEYTYAEMTTQFSMEPLAWQCEPHGGSFGSNG
jgi:hypothetical protein